MARYFVRETWTSDNPATERSRVEARFETDATERWDILRAALVAIHGDDDLIGECFADEVIADGPDRFHAECWTNGGRYQWAVSPVADRPEPLPNTKDAPTRQRTMFAEKGR